MKNNILLFTMLLNLTLSGSVYAEIIKQKKLNFKFDSENLMKGDIQYSYRLSTAEKIKEKLPEIAELDSSGLLKYKDANFLISKAVFVIKKPIGFFDHKQMIEKSYLKHVGQFENIKDIKEGTFQIEQPGNDHIQKIYFDSDDISTLEDAKAVRAVTALKKLDIISKSAPAILLKEYSNYDRGQHGTVNITSFVPLKEDKTLAITYYLTAFKKGSNPISSSDLVEALKSHKTLIESYKTK